MHSKIPFGTSYVDPESLVRHYFSLYGKSVETWVDVSRALATWRRENRMTAFEDLFKVIRKHPMDGRLAALVVSVIKASEPISKFLPGHTDFLHWAKTKAEETFDENQARWIKTRLG